MIFIPGILLAAIFIAFVFACKIGFHEWDEPGGYCIHCGAHDRFSCYTCTQKDEKDRREKGIK